MDNDMMKYAGIQFANFMGIKDEFKAVYAILLDAHETVESILRVLSEKKIGRYAKTRNLKILMRDCKEPELYNRYYNLLDILTNTYFTITYDSEIKEDITATKLEKIIEDAIQLYSKINDLIENTDIKQVNAFTKIRR